MWLPHLLSPHVLEGPSVSPVAEAQDSFVHFWKYSRRGCGSEYRLLDWESATVSVFFLNKREKEGF